MISNKLGEHANCTEFKLRIAFFVEMSPKNAADILVVIDIWP